MGCYSLVSSQGLGIPILWGMLNGPATGEAMAELIVDGATSTVDITPFDPARLGPRAVRTADPWATRLPQSG